MAKVLQFSSGIFYQIKISLGGIKPPIWRRVIVNSNITLPDLHKIIQTVMGWSNSHLHQFVIEGKLYSEPDDEGSFVEVFDYRAIKLNQVMLHVKDKIIYEYDFGDDWGHNIVLEKILSCQDQHPLCLGGKRACPPEDCGGPYRYPEILEILADPGHGEYEEVYSWMGDDFDSEFFDLEEVNELLQEEDFGCLCYD